MDQKLSEALPVIVFGTIRTEAEKAEMDYLIEELSRQMEFDGSRVRKAMHHCNLDLRALVDTIADVLSKHQLMSEPMEDWARKWVSFNIRLMCASINAGELVKKEKRKGGRAKLEVTEIN